MFHITALKRGVNDNHSQFFSTTILPVSYFCPVICTGALVAVAGSPGI